MPASTLELRLACFLKEVQPLLQQHRRAPSTRVTVAKVKHLLNDIHPKLHAARAAGKFMNIWSAAGLRRNELRNAAVLAWLLDPLGTHGLDDRMANAFFSRVRRSPTWLGQRTDFRAMTVVTEERPLGSSENRVDISVTGPTFIMFIEVKIDAPEGVRQLDRYLKEIELKSASLGGCEGAVVFLTRHGEPTNSDCASLAWRDVEHALAEVAKSLPLSDARKTMLIQFAEHIQSF